ncbi:MAG: class II aldolase and adducin N-terminal domain-containing protein [Pseudomonadota bacterium]
MAVAEHKLTNIAYLKERVDLAAAFRWAARYNMHEAVANHFSCAVNADGTQFLMNPNCTHFARIKASDLLLLDAHDPSTLDHPNAPDVTAWGLHGALHRLCPHARCAMHVHSAFATVFACLEQAHLPPIDQNAAMFFNRHVVDGEFGGMAMGDEGARCVALLQDPKVKTLIMGNHGVMIIGETLAETFNRLYYFERAAETYIRALQTGQKLRILSDAVAEKTAQEWEDYPNLAEAHLRELKLILDGEGSDYGA